MYGNGAGIDMTLNTMVAHQRAIRWALNREQNVFVEEGLSLPAVRMPEYLFVDGLNQMSDGWGWGFELQEMAKNWIYQSCSSEKIVPLRTI